MGFDNFSEIVEDFYFYYLDKPRSRKLVIYKSKKKKS